MKQRTSWEKEEVYSSNIHKHSYTHTCIHRRRRAYQIWSFAHALAIYTRAITNTNIILLQVRFFSSFLSFKRHCVYEFSVCVWCVAFIVQNSFHSQFWWKCRTNVCQPIFCLLTNFVIFLLCFNNFLSYIDLVHQFYNDFVVDKSKRRFKQNNKRKTEFFQSFFCSSCFIFCKHLNRSKENGIALKICYLIVVAIILHCGIIMFKFLLMVFMWYYVFVAVVGGR